MSRKTIVDVARAAGVAIKTVSRVLNDEPNVRPDTRARVLAAMESLSYFPSVSARSLAGRRSCLIGLVYENPSANYLVDIQHGAMARCRQEKFRLFVHQCSGRGEELIRDVMGLVDQTHVDGLVICALLPHTADLIRALDARQLPFVRISPSGVAHRSPFVDIDDEGAARQMTQHLIGLGHRRVAFIAGDPGHDATRQRLRGFQQALHAHRLRPEPQYLKQGRFTFESGLSAGRELLGLSSAPTAVFASSDDMAAGVLVAAHELGIRVPQELSVAGFDDTCIAKMTWPRLTTIHQPSYDLAWSATELLLQVLKGGDSSRSMRLPFQLIVRESTGPVAAVQARAR